MKLNISTIINDEPEELSSLEFSPCGLDFSMATPEEVLGYKNRWQSVVLPTKEVLDVQAEFGKGHSVSSITVRQEQHTICHIIASEIIAFSFITLKGMSIIVELNKHEI